VGKSFRLKFSCVMSSVIPPYRDTETETTTYRTSSEFVLSIIVRVVIGLFAVALHDRHAGQGVRVSRVGIAIRVSLGLPRHKYGGARAHVSKKMPRPLK
jgi:hypothetical protein